MELIGSELGAYMTGDASGSYLHGSAFAEVERWIGPFRLTSGVRAGVENKASRVFLEPRLAARYRQESFAVSATLDRTYQFLSVLRDALYTLPGAPMWFVHDSSRPASVADGASLALDLWRGGRLDRIIGRVGPSVPGRSALASRHVPRLRRAGVQ